MAAAALTERWSHDGGEMGGCNGQGLSRRMRTEWEKATSETGNGMRGTERETESEGRKEYGKGIQAYGSKLEVPRLSYGAQR